MVDIFAPWWVSAAAAFSFLLAWPAQGTVRFGHLTSIHHSHNKCGPNQAFVGWYKLMAWLHPQLALCCFLQVHALSADGASLASTCNGTQSTQHQSSKGKQAGQLRCSSRETSHSTQKHSNEHRNAARPCGAPVTVRNSVQQHAAAA